MTARKLAVLGSTGSVGEQTLEVAAGFADRFRITALAAGRNVDKLAEQVKRFRPERVSLTDEADVARLREGLGSDAGTTRFASGDDGLDAVATHDADLVMAAMVGAAGLRPTLAAIRAGRDVALANKEVLVMAGALVRREIAARGTTLLPVDSEHNAIFQALAGQRRVDVARLLLTASGGPFRTWQAERIARASVSEALDHPNWDMGPKITIDSASLMNKGLEVIEARWLFDVPPERVDVVVHPQSIIHSLVEFVDGSVLAQLGLPDMRVPIAVCLAHPERLPLDLPRLDLAQQARLDFEAPDVARFPNLGLAYRALEGSETAPAVLNAANEVAVAAFLDERIPFGTLSEVNRQVLELHLNERAGEKVETLDAVVAADAWARARAREQVEKSAKAWEGPTQC